MEKSISRIHTIENIKEGDLFKGKYHPKNEQKYALLNKFKIDSRPAINTAVLLMWSSYFIGMVMPGRQALYSQFELTINKSLEAWLDQIEYNVTIEKRDGRFNLLEMAYELSDHIKIAEGKLSAFVRPIINQVIIKQNNIPEEYKGALAGKTALITGASRGLGAVLAQLLSAMSCQVIINFQQSLDEAVKVGEKIKEFGGAFELWQGDIADIDWLSLKKDEMLSKGRKLDILICNACQAPKEINFEQNTAARIDEYILKNLEMTTIPLSLFAPMLNAACGYGIIISSTAVAEPLAAWPHYISLKSAIEGLIASISIKYKKTNWFVVRPPRLLTDMSNSPMGNYASADPYIIAAKICDYIFIQNKKNKRVDIFTPQL
jgi:NAD(P)-dependent dehydrogenase (short-subunit alcohol dehydrogenase family)